MENVKKISRITLGLILLVYGTNHFFGNFLEMPVSPQGEEFLKSMGYWLSFVKMLEILAGLALLSNRYVPLAVLVVAPISVNILAFHLMFDVKGILPGLLVAVLNGFLISRNFVFFRPFLAGKPQR